MTMLSFYGMGLKKMLLQIEQCVEIVVEYAVRPSAKES